MELCEGLGPAPASSVSGLSPDGDRVLPAIGELPEDVREVFDLVWIDRMTQAEAAQVLGGSIIRVCAEAAGSHPTSRGGCIHRRKGSGPPRPDVVSP